MSISCNSLIVSGVRLIKWLFHNLELVELDCRCFKDRKVMPLSFSKEASNFSTYFTPDREEKPRNTDLIDTDLRDNDMCLSHSTGCLPLVTAFTLSIIWLYS
jgi:hypothetical protein